MSDDDDEFDREKRDDVYFPIINDVINNKNIFPVFNNDVISNHYYVIIEKGDNDVIISQNPNLSINNDVILFWGRESSKEHSSERKNDNFERALIYVRLGPLKCTFFNELCVMF